MTSLRRLLLGTGLLGILLAAGSSLQASTSLSGEDWMNNYYKKPDPAGLTSSMLQLSRFGYFEEQGHTTLAIGFLSKVFAQNPERVDGWMSFAKALPAEHQRLFVAALWYSGNPRGAQMLREYAANAPEEIRDSIDAIISKNRPLAETPVLSASSLNLQWGAFLATGDSAPVRTILASLGEDNSLSTEIRWKLAQNAVQHERVLAICREELTRQPNSVQETLRAVISEAEGKATKHSS